MTHDLKKCPYCGSEAELMRRSGGTSFVRCADTQCHARTRDFHDNENGAVYNWNKRCGDER